MVYQRKAKLVLASFVLGLASFFVIPVMVFLNYSLLGDPGHADPKLTMVHAIMVAAATVYIAITGFSLSLVVWVNLKFQRDLKTTLISAGSVLVILFSFMTVGLYIISMMLSLFSGFIGG